MLGVARLPKLEGHRPENGNTSVQNSFGVDMNDRARPAQRQTGSRLQVCGPQVLSNPDFAPAVGFARLGGGSDGGWRGAFGIAQRQISARVAGRRELGRGSPSELRVWSCVVVIGPPTSK